MSIKKIAIITFGFQGSSSSLVEALLRQGHRVDFYNIVYESQKNYSFESFELPISTFVMGMNKIVDFQQNGLRRYMPFSEYLGLFVVKTWGMPDGNGIMDKIKRGVSSCSLWWFAQSIVRSQYDLVNVIGQNRYMLSLSVFLHQKNVNVVHSLHEIYKNHLIEDDLFPHASTLIQKKVRITVFSEKSANDLQKLVSMDSNYLSVIPFGLFTGYREYPQVDVPELRGKVGFVLYYGYILPYKGLDVLYEAEKLLNGESLHIVIAGRGFDPVLEKMRDNPHFTLINRWLSNIELVSLIRLCKYVVCPYLSSSQSGIPQTVFNFGKPIVATRVAAFNETIYEGKSGLLAETGSCFSLAEKMKIMNDENAYDKMTEYLTTYAMSESYKQWMGITDMYLKLI